MTRNLFAVMGAGVALTACLYVQGCVDWSAKPVLAQDEGGTDGQAADAGPPLGPILPSCEGLEAQCAGESCCAANDVPGGTFKRMNDDKFPATVSTFRLDTYEVVVGRFRAFVNAGQGTYDHPPAEGAGAHPKIPGSGWKSAFKDGLTDDKESFVAALKCDPDLYNAYSETPGVNDTLPMNCVTWFEAFAFCAWDGGRLPTEAEWNYAAAGGSEQRVYPWGGDTIDKKHVSYGCQSGDSIAAPGAPACTFNDYTAAGSHPAGKGRWGHADLVGNVWERTLDYFVDPFRITPCVDCADLEQTVAAQGKGIRGGSINWGEAFHRTTNRTAVNSEELETRTNTVGFRCARATR